MSLCLSKNTRNVEVWSNSINKNIGLYGLANCDYSNSVKQGKLGANLLLDLDTDIECYEFVKRITNI